ncbi:hypothetical protein BGZ83_005904 [Gryganskiella cystojenkinii]|nr:hypothetical protein BGZ83_005904 [Gryganskiella cystojenkinii]
MATFLRLHQESLKSFVGYEVNSGVVLDALAKCKKIEKVQIQHLHLSSPNIFFDRYPTLWSQLKTLSLGGCWFNTGKDIDKILLGVRKKVEKQAKIQHLTIRTPEGDHAVYELQALLIKNCPELVSLSWAPGSLVRKNKTGAIIHLAKAIEFGYKFPKLESIHVEGDKNFRNQELAVVLRGLPSLTNVALPETSFDVACWDFMKRGIPRYMTSLKELDLGGCAFTTGAMVHNVLCSAPTLEVFRGNYIKTSNFQNDRRPWVCTGLKKLTLEFILDLGDDETQICKAGRMTFERISQLVQLEELSLDSHYGRVDSYSNYGRNDSFWAKHRDGEWDGVLQLKEAQPVLQFLLAQGLEQLGTLRSLRILGGLRLSDSMLDYQGTELEEAETNWMVEHLPELKETREFPTSFKAGEILRKRGIKKKDSGIIPPHKFRKNCSIS